MGIHLTARRKCFILITACLLDTIPSSLASPQSSNKVWYNSLGGRSGPIGSWDRRYIHPRGNVGYDDPANNGGQMLTIVNGTYPAGQGEPLNVIISAQSDADVLARNSDQGGFLNYMLSTFLGEECLGQHLGSPQQANLGDGHGIVDEVEELRWDFGNPYIGTCQETFDGGLHLRYWIQNTTGAYFMAVSVEMDLNSDHDIIRDGYNIGRDYLVGNLTGHQVVPYNVTSQTTFSGLTNFGNYSYQTDVQYVPGLLQNTSLGINHNLTVETSRHPAIDGLVAVLTVRIVSQPQSSASMTTYSPTPFIALAFPLVVLGGFVALS